MSLDRRLFEGRLDVREDVPAYPSARHASSPSFPREALAAFLREHGAATLSPPDASTKPALRAMAEQRLFSMAIPQADGGHGLSTEAMAAALAEITSRSPALGVAAMVPNSLGPAELLLHYGTAAQRAEYLPRLARGDFVPCFGLTGPTNSSDALGSIDRGTVRRDARAGPPIEVTVDKRYLTLAPIANLVGLAFDVEDPDGLLPGERAGGHRGLLERDHPGLRLDATTTLRVGFPNGTAGRSGSRWRR